MSTRAAVPRLSPPLATVGKASPTATSKSPRKSPQQLSNGTAVAALKARLAELETRQKQRQRDERSTAAGRAAATAIHFGSGSPASSSIESPASPPKSPRQYDKYSYALRRQREPKDAVPLSTILPTPAWRPHETVVRPLRPTRFGFAIAEDGVIHSRIVSPPRVCFAPEVRVVRREDAEAVGAEDMALDDPWERLRAAMGAATTTDGDIVALPIAELREWCGSVGLGPLESARIELRWKATPRSTGTAFQEVGHAGPRTAALAASASSAATCSSASATAKKSPRTVGSPSAPPVPVRNGKAAAASGSSAAPRPSSNHASGGTTAARRKHIIFNEKLQWSAAPRVDSRRATSAKQ
jgi:hypothetical protein